MDDSAINRDAESTLRTLVAFSAARSFSVNSNNPLDVVLPLFEPIAAARHGQLFVAYECANELSVRYDLVVSEELCHHWTGQLIKQGLLVPAAGTGGFLWNQVNIPNAAAGEFAAELLSILRELRTFLKSRGDILLNRYTDSELVKILKQGAISSMFPKLFDQEVGARSDEQYIFSRFLQYASKSKPSIVDSLATLRRAAVFCDLILHSREPRRPPAAPSSVAVYFDSPLVMDLIGLGGKARKEHAKRLLQGFQQLNFQPLINPEMVFEVGNNIKGILNLQARDRYGPTADALRRSEFRIDFVEAVRDHLEEQIRSAGIHIDKNFDAHVERSKIDSAKEQALLADVQSQYSHLEAAERDIRTIRGVLGRRGEIPPRDLYASKALFLTSNKLLATLANRFCRAQLAYDRAAFPLVVTRPIAAALADAILGVSSTGNMSLTEMLVSAADATQYNPKVFARIEEHLKNLAPQQASDLLEILTRPDFAQMAMDLACGNPSNVTVESVAQLTEVIKSRFEADAEAKIAEERAIERKRAAEEAGEHRNTIETQRERIAAIEGELRGRHSRDLNTLMARLRASLHRQGIAHRLYSLVGILVGVAVGTAVYVGTYYADFMQQSPLWRWVTAIVCAIGAGVPLTGLPTVREFVIRKYVAWEVSRIILLAKELGYQITPTDCLTSVGLTSALESRFDEKLSALVGTEAKASSRRDLFDEQAGEPSI